MSPHPLHGSLQRRREAARHLKPLACGCRDPLFCRCRPTLHERPPLTEKMIDAGRDTAHHLLENGFVPLLQPDVLHALHRRGDDDRQLARELYALVGDAA